MTDNRRKTGIKRMKAALLSVLLLIVLSTGVLAYAAEDTDKATEASAAAEPVKCASGVLVMPIGDLDAEAPEIAANSAAMYSLDMNRPVYGKNEEKIAEPYSTTKLLTCWLALENLDPGKVVTASEESTQVYENGTTIWLKPGEQMTVRDLVYGAMLESGNDAAYALGEAVAGSESAFADLMNETVKSWGCENTHFVNANGWKNEEHYTTASDLAVITAKCLENSELREISMTKDYVIPATNMSEARELKNYFLAVAGKTKNLTGGKTGTWSDDDCGIVASFRRQGLEEVIVLLEDTKDGRTKDLRKLIKFSHDVTPGFEVPAADCNVETAWIRHGKKTRAELTVDKSTYAYPLDNDAGEIDTEIIYDKIEAPLKKGDEVGEFLVYADDELIGKHKLVMAEDVETGWLPSYIYISNRVTTIILAVIGSLVLLILLLRFYNKKIRKKRRRPSSGNQRPAAADHRPVSPDQRPSSAGLRPDSSDRRPSTGKRSSKEKREARRRLREKYRDKH